MRNQPFNFSNTKRVTVRSVVQLNNDKKIFRNLNQDIRAVIGVFYAVLSCSI